MSVDHDRVYEAFLMCKELEREEQEAKLADFCGDDTVLFSEVVTLLEADYKNDSEEGFCEWTGERRHLRYEKGHRIGPFKVEEFVGSGSFGEVYKASDRAGNYVAIKLLLPWVNTPRQLARFHRESEAMRKIDHASVAPLLRTGSHQETPFLVTKFIDGTTLQEKIDSDPNISIRRRVQWLLQVCHGISAAHKYLVLHRDLKPSNIIIGSDDRAVVTDFGTAKFLDQTESKFDFTATGELLGTPKYMAPEQLQSTSDLVLATDVYGLGGIMYFLLAGRGPFEGESFLEIADSVRNSTPTPLQSIDSKVDKDLVTICNKCLRKEPASRYQSVSELSQELENWLQGRPVQARQLGRLEKTYYWVRRNPTTAVLSGLLVASMIVGLTATSFLWVKAESNYKESQVTLARWRARNGDLVKIISTLTEVEKKAQVKKPDLGFRRSVLETVVEGYGQLDNPDPDTPKTEGLAWLRLGRIIGQMEDRQSSILALEKARKIFTELAEEDPEKIVYLFDVFHCLNSQMRYSPALEVMEQVYLAEPEVPHYVDAFSHANLMVAQDYFYEGEYEKMVPYLDLAEKVIVDLNATYDGVRGPLNRKKQGEIWGLKGCLCLVMGQEKKGLKYLKKAIAEFDYCMKKMPKEAEIESQKFYHLRTYAAYFAVIGDFRKSLEIYKEVDKLTKEMTVKYTWFPGSLQFRFMGLRDHLYVAVELDDQDEIDRIQNELNLIVEEWTSVDPVKPFAKRSMMDFFVDFHSNQRPSLEKAQQLAGEELGRSERICEFWECVSRKDFQVARTFKEFISPSLLETHYSFLFDILDQMEQGSVVEIGDYKPWTKKHRMEMIAKRRWLPDAFLDKHFGKTLVGLGVKIQDPK